ncbi:DUF2306 domain-containing protein [Paenibacillus sp. FJAT-27812]|uniref:DUF2306 domain-containing protein n=1 Tax=Paenibacillus sp. FJAT-27812 TaxID=1684143 RepID=UPI0006A7B064|nr:DUF2306 domain-containing protein [Paenibacillus sp. FJAT-27812]
MSARGKAGRTWALAVLAFLALAVGAYALVFYGSPDGIEDQPFVSEKGSLPDLWLTVLWAHAVSAGIGLAIGWLQLIKRLRHRSPNVHRLIGYVYSMMIVIGGITGLYLAFYAEGVWIAKLGFGALSLAWLYSLFRSLKSIIVNRDPAEHGRWMIRNYALTCAAITLRIYTALAAVLFGLTDTNDTFIVIAWLCWVPNLLFVELLFNKKKPKSRMPQPRQHARL